VNALDGFTVAEGARGASLCAQDLLLTHFGADEPALVKSTRHRIRTWDHAGRPLPLETWRTGGAQLCVDGISPASDNDGYTIVGIDTFRSGDKPQRILVHLAREPRSRALRVIGLRRY
jgi:hypothetical protein